MYDSKEAGESF